MVKREVSALGAYREVMAPDFFFFLLMLISPRYYFKVKILILIGVLLKVNIGGIVMMTDSKSDEPEDLIEPLPGK